MEKHRTTLSLLLVVIGASLLFYGLFGKATVVSSDDSPEVAEAVLDAVAEAPEPVVAQPQEQQQEVAKDEVKPDIPAQIKKTSGGGEKAPAACPT